MSYGDYDDVNKARDLIRSAVVEDPRLSFEGIGDIPISYLEISPEIRNDDEPIPNGIATEYSHP